MPEDSSLDITGVGKLAKAIPQKAWVQVVDTACTTFQKVVAPLTALSSGIGRLVEAKFDRLVEAEKVLVSDIFAKANERAKPNNREKTAHPNARILISVIDGSSTETDILLRELWANLLAREISSGAVHPEFPTILGRLSAQDAQTLSQIAESTGSQNIALKTFIGKISVSILGINLHTKQATSFIHEHLQKLGLIGWSNDTWHLTHTGQEFLKVVGGDMNEGAA